MTFDQAYQWVVSRVECVTPFGQELVRRPRWYGPGDEGELEEEFDRLEQVLAWEDTAALAHELSYFREIRGLLGRESAAPMDVVELFELKHFLLHLKRTALLYGNTLPGVELSPMGDMLSLLDPSGREMPPFHIENAYDPALEGIRAAKGAAATEEERSRLVEREHRVELEVRRRLSDALLREKERFLRNTEALGRLDWLLAKAALVKRYGCCRPEITPDGEVMLEDMIHPQVAHALQGKGLLFTPVSLLLERGTTVITGANMGGKSVSLQAAAMNLRLMHTGYFPFADAVRGPLFHAVELLGADGQDAVGGLSSFGAEMKGLDGILRREKGRKFFLALDEFARGTNPAEGSALARALVEYLNGLNCVAVMSTHYDGVSSAARRHYRVAGLEDGVTGTLEDLPRLMDYTLRLADPDEPCPRDAAAVCRMLDLEEDFVSALLDR